MAIHSKLGSERLCQGMATYRLASLRILIALGFDSAFEPIADSSTSDLPETRRDSNSNPEPAPRVVPRCARNDKDALSW